MTDAEQDPTAEEQRFADGDQDRLREGPSRAKRYWQEWTDSRFTYRTRGPLARFLLYTASAQPRILDLVPEEENNYLRLGTSVLVTTALAFFSGVVAAQILLERPLDSTTLAIGGLFALLIYSLDRILITQPINPYRFPSSLLESFWNPGADADYFSALAKALNTPSATRRVKQFVGSIASVAIRFAMAVVISLLIAELVALKVFEDRIGERIESLDRAAFADRRDSINEQFDGEADAIQIQITQLVADLDRFGGAEGDSDQLEAELSELNAALGTCQQDLVDVADAAAAEQEGEKKVFEILGTTIETSGDAGPGPVTRAIATLSADVRAECSRLQSEIERVRAELDEPPAEPTTEEVDVRTALTNARSRLQNIEALRSEELAALCAPGLDAAAEATDRTDVSDVEALQIAEQTECSTGSSDLLTRRQALEELVRDADPTTAAIDEASDACEGFFGCPIIRFFYPATPIGNWVGLFRAFLLLVDMLPILYKLGLSLRVRRPYDAVLAAIEERHVASAFNLVDSRVSDVGQLRELRSFARKGFRAGSGAEAIFRSAARAAQEANEQKQSFRARAVTRFGSKRRAAAEAVADQAGRNAQQDASNEGPTVHWDP